MIKRKVKSSKQVESLILQTAERINNNNNKEKTHRHTIEVKEPDR